MRFFKGEIIGEERALGKECIIGGELIVGE